MLSHQSCAGIFPDRMLDVYDGRHQRDETKIALDHGEQRANPAAIACPEHAKLRATAPAERSHQLSKLHHTLAQTLGIADEIGRDRELAVPIPPGHTRVMIWQVDEAGVPAQRVEMRGPAPVANARGRKQRMKHQYGRRLPAVR